MTTPRAGSARGVVKGVGQEALGATDSAGDEDGLIRSVDGAVLGTVVLGVDVLAGVLQAATAPPIEAARARASRMRLAMGISPPMFRVAGIRRTRVRPRDHRGRR
jgi:hypothetical protein